MERGERVRGGGEARTWTTINGGQKSKKREEALDRERRERKVRGHMKGRKGRRNWTGKEEMGRLEDTRVRKERKKWTGEEEKGKLSLRPYHVAALSLSRF